MTVWSYSVEILNPYEATVESVARELARERAEAERESHRGRLRAAARRLRALIGGERP